MQSILKIGISLGLCFLVSCRIALPPHKQVEHLKATPQINQAVQTKLKDKKIFKAGNWPNKRWWLAYNSPELNCLIQDALSESPSLQEVRSRVQVAKQEALVTRSALFPLLFFDATENRQYLSKNGLYRALNHNLPLSVTLLDLSLSFTYDFDFWGQNHNLFYEAIGKVKAQQAEAAEVRLLITTALAQAYFAYQVNLVKKQFYEQLVTVRSNIVNLQNIMLKKGLADELPAYAAEENLLEAKKLLSSIQEEIAVDKHLVNVLAGRNPEAPLSLHPKLPGLPRQLQIPQTISLDLIARRPDLMAQIWRAKALAYKTGAAMADYLPNVNLTGLVGLESTSWKKLLQGSSFTAALRPAIHLPIFTAGAIKANIKATKAEFDAAIFAYNALLLRSTQEVLDTLDFAQRVYQQKREQIGILNSTNKRYNLTVLREREGLDSGFNIYNLQEELIEKKLVNLGLLYNQYLASIKLIKALGGGYCQVNVPLERQS
ncbi:efflux transporter outer membrane subunit [Legionella jamestowniensis]|uniref:Outer membrane efflux lipoprotein n=1 Tax=Legionella jamestowniensis TaxID=455 RepID=A0A0W0ULK8_9GAMM|nr:efflux transporter outer membrane subunit [Legionella jamestowniensis]KTD08655.1 outer membrane efflux lipoprotein [Legionella jamestowniensis]OCH96899.1 RND transporter [Legionella jamestowniensis]SFL54287.1 efflux transporter, outer membrane factor (OMF) lipoprotein, NodT family [Legionella jamestowniensis DSM 19215]